MQTVTLEPDVVWTTRVARLAGLGGRVAERVAVGPVLVVAHFADRMAELEGLAAAADTPWRALASEAHVAEWMTGATASPTVGLASVALVRSASSRIGHPAHAASLAVLAVERHPLRECDTELEQTLASLPIPSSLQFHLSLEDALLGVFGAVETKLMLTTTLGMRDDEPIEAAMLTRAVAIAQRQLARSVRSRIDAASAEAWLRVNRQP